MSNSKDKLYPTIFFSEDKDMVAVIVTSANGISEEEFLAALLDLVNEFKDGFRYEDNCELVEADFVIDEEDLNGIRH